MSKLEVDAIEPQSGTTLTLGASGDSVNIASGASLTSANPMVFPAGTASLPAITTTGDLNTGIFFPAADTIGFAEGGVEAMRITSAGRVGIGTSSPNQELEVNGQIRFGFSVTIDGGIVSTGDMDDFKTSGFYRFDSAVSNTPTSHIYATVIFGNGANVVTQIATRIANTVTYVRSFNTSWTSWVRLDT